VRSLSHILLPVDFSERAVAAARSARFLAQHFHSNLTLLHVIPLAHYDLGPLDAPGTLLADVSRNRAEQASRELDSFLAAELSGPAVERVVLEGDPAAHIVEYAHGHHADLIAMPTHGYGPFRRFILGSNTAKVLHDADCPVWTGVHIPETTAGSPSAAAPIQHVRCAVDLGPQSAKALEWAAWLQREFDAGLTLLHVAAAAAEHSPGAETHWRTRIREAASEELDRLRQAAGVQADIAVEAGEAASAICAVAARLDASVLVIGRGSASGVFGRLRTNAYAIIRQAPCPVVSV
jgi:nucleotide-binding universal stress UspA family protein